MDTLKEGITDVIKITSICGLFMIYTNHINMYANTDLRFLQMNYCMSIGTILSLSLILIRKYM